MPNPLRRFAGDPTHPATVHFPLALYPAVILFDILALAGAGGVGAAGSGTYTRAAFILIVAATVMALVAMLTGFVQLFDVPAASPAWRLAIIHMSVQLTAACVLVGSLLTRLGHIDDAHPPLVAIILAIVGTLILFVGGWMGGHLVFTHGVSVEHSDEQPRLTPAPTVVPTPARNDGADEIASAAPESIRSPRP